MTAPRGPVDLLAVLEAQQQQIDDLTDAVQAQQRTLALLAARLQVPATPTGTGGDASDRAPRPGRP